MKITRLFHLDCSEAESLCDKAQYREAGFRDRIRLRLHYLLCEACRKYQVDNAKLTSLIKKAGIQSYSREEKEALRRKMEAESSNIGKDHQK